MRRRRRGVEPSTFLVAVLFARGCVNAWFALWLVTRGSQWSDVFETGADYALTDGALGLATVLLLMEFGPTGPSFVLRTMTLADAMLRLTAAVLLRTFPGLPGFPVTLLMFFTVIGVWEVSLGVTLMVYWLVAVQRDARAESADRKSRRATLGPPAIAGLVALLFAGSALVVGPPATADALRTVAASAATVLAIVFVTAAVRTSRPPPQS